MPDSRLARCCPPDVHVFRLVAVPLYGQLWPKEVPFLVAFRPCKNIPPLL